MIKKSGCKYTNLPKHNNITINIKTTASMDKIALITGATSGIGEATAKKLAILGHNLIVTGRRLERLEKLKNELEAEFSIKVLILNFDIRKNDETTAALNSLPENWKKIDVLVNNAGLAAGLEKFQDGHWSDWEQMIDTNVKGLLFISRIVTPWMIERKKGHVINISSIAGIEAYEKGSVYCGTKHAVQAISKGMRIDFLPHNIKVTTICPGWVETEFSVVRFKGDTERASNFYNGLTPLYAEDIADAIEFVVTRKPHVCINDMLIMPTAQATATYNYRE